MTIDPEKILTENKERDAKILADFWVEKKSQRQIAEEQNLSQVRINQILYANRSLIKYDADFEKNKRIRKYEEELEKSETIKHDSEYWMDKIRDEIEVASNNSNEEKPSWLTDRLAQGTQN